MKLDLTPKPSPCFLCNKLKDNCNCYEDERVEFAHFLIATADIGPGLWEDLEFDLNDPACQYQLAKALAEYLTVPEQYRISKAADGGELEC